MTLSFNTLLTRARCAHHGMAHDSPGQQEQKYFQEPKGRQHLPHWQWRASSPLACGLLRQGALHGSIAIGGCHARLTSPLRVVDGPRPGRGLHERCGGSMRKVWR